MLFICIRLRNRNTYMSIQHIELTRASFRWSLLSVATPPPDSPSKKRHTIDESSINGERLTSLICETRKRIPYGNTVCSIFIVSLFYDCIELAYVRTHVIYRAT